MKILPIILISTVTIIPCMSESAAAPKPASKFILHNVTTDKTLNQAVDHVKQYKESPLYLREEDTKGHDIFSCEFIIKEFQCTKTGAGYWLDFFEKATQAIKAIQQQEREATLNKLEKDMADNAKAIEAAQKKATELAAQKAALLAAAGQKDPE